MTNSTISGSWQFHNALTERAIGGTDPRIAPISIGVILINRATGEEILLDILCDDGAFATVSAAIRRFYSAKEWGIFETWEIEGHDFAPVPALAVAGVAA